MQGTITRIFKETSDVYGFYIKLEKNSGEYDNTGEYDNADEDDKPFSYIHGQYVMLAFPDDAESKRPFSIVEYSPSSMEILVLLKKHASFTQRMFDSKVGQRIDVFGPYGRFTLHPENAYETEGKPLVFIAGGIGITPIYSMLMEAAANADEFGNHIHLFYTAKNKEQMPFYDRIKDDIKKHEKHETHETNETHETHEKHDRIKITFHFTEQCDGEKSKRLCCDDVTRELADYKDSIYYVCGPGAMIESFRQGLIEKGISEDRIRSEEFT